MLDDLLLSSTDLAVTVTVPAVTPVSTPDCDTIATAGVDVDQSSACDAPFTTVTVALSVTGVPITTGAVSGAMTTDTTAGVATTVMTEKADFDASNTDVAVMFAEPAARPVTTPLPLTVAIAGFDVVQVTDVEAPPTAVTFAVNACVPPTLMLAFAGVIVTALTAGRTFTVIDCVALLLASAVALAVIVAEPGVTPCTRPADDTVAIDASDVDHVTAVEAPFNTVTVAVN